MEGKVIAITGCSGIGLAVAKQLHTKGARLSIADISQSALDTGVAELGGSADSVFAKVVDVGDRAQVDAWIAETVEKFGQLDGAANMAGVIGKHHGVRELREQDDAEWDFIYRVNVTGLMYCLRAQIRAITSPDNGGAKRGGASIVNAASIQGTRGFAKHAAYSSSKHAVIGLTRSVAKEVAKDGIRVNCVAPGAIQTPLLDKAVAIIGAHDAAECLMGRTGTAEEVAGLVVWLLGQEGSYVTGSVFGVDGGWNC